MDLCPGRCPPFPTSRKEGEGWKRRVKGGRGEGRLEEEDRGLKVAKGRRGGRSLKVDDEGWKRRAKGGRGW